MLYRFQIEFSDVDRGIYQTLDFRAAQHPSETLSYLLTRCLAYCLSYQENIEFSPGGLGDPDAPALRAIAANGNIDLWIEVGNPSARRLHKASKTAKNVEIYTYKNVNLLLNELKNEDVHRSQDIKIYSLDQKFLENLESSIEKNNRWTLLYQQGHMDLNVGQTSFSTEISQYSF